MTLGLREVTRRRSAFLALGPRDRAAYITQRTVPCVLGPAGVLYLIDRHHMCRALLGAGYDTVQGAVQCDVSLLAPEEFWRFMDLRGWVHPFDREGERKPVSALPARISGLVDDPYRALAGQLRRAQGFEKADTPFEEFIWADFLRFRIAEKTIKDDFEAAGGGAGVSEGLDVWRSEDTGLSREQAGEEGED